MFMLSSPRPTFPIREQQICSLYLDKKGKKRVYSVRGSERAKINGSYSSSPPFFQQILLSCSSFVICNNIHVHWLEGPQNICPTNKARPVLSYPFLCCERKRTTLKVSPCWRHLCWRGSCPCFRGSAPEPLTWRTVEWGSARSPRLKDRQTHRKRDVTALLY